MSGEPINIIRSGSSGSSGGGGGWGAAKNVTIISGAITVVSGGWYKIITESLAVSDDLDTINGLSEGDSVMLSADDGTKTVVLKNGTDNLDIKSDISLNDAVDMVILIHNGINLIEQSSRP